MTVLQVDLAPEGLVEPSVALNALRASKKGIPAYHLSQTWRGLTRALDVDLTPARGAMCERLVATWPEGIRLLIGHLQP